jgi:hypothetical protein
VQVGANVQFDTAHVDQSITQSQSLESGKGDIYGSQQNQTALNIAVDSRGGSQTIVQNQSISYE